MKPDGSPESGPMTTKSDGNAVSDDGIIAELQTRMEMAAVAESDNYRDGLDDLQFLKGDQWPEKQRRQREADGRPILTVNKLPTFLQQVTNDQRQNQSSIKVSPVGLNTKPETAELLQGMIRHIEYVSNADVACDTAVNSAAAIGFGYFRIVTEYCGEDSFDQEIRFKRIRNPFTVYCDPMSVEADGSDMQWCIISEKMSREEFKARYPQAEITFAGFNVQRQGDNGRLARWVFSNAVRVAEYYRIEKVAATLYMVSQTQEDGTTKTWAAWTEQGLPEGATVIDKRQSTRSKVMWYKVTPYEILERTEIKCKWIPVFPVYGTEIDVDGKVYRAGLIRNAKDPAMMYNFWMTSATEELAMRPKTPYIGAEGQFKGQENRWRQANNRTFAYLEYNPVSVEGQLAPPPARQPMADIPIGFLTMATHASDNIKSTTGLFDSSLGAQGNATSGKQELAQQKQGNVANFHYTDNLTRTRRHAGRCILDMIPHYYDTERVVQCMGEDGKIKAEVINKWTEAANEIINNVKVGEYAVVISTGPSYQTMRAEAADAMIQFGQSWPKLMDIAGDKVVEAMNWPGATAIADRIKRTIPAEIADDPKEGGPPPIPPEAQAQIQQLQQQLAELQEKADANHAKVTIAEIQREGTQAITKFKEQAESERLRFQEQAETERKILDGEIRKDVEELKGGIQLLLARIPPPAPAEPDGDEGSASDEGSSR